MYISEYKWAPDDIALKVKHGNRTYNLSFCFAIYD